jgi:hypothetical protein
MPPASASVVKVRMSDSVDVAATVRTDVALGVDVPTPKWNSSAVELMCRRDWAEIVDGSL